MSDSQQESSESGPPDPAPVDESRGPEPVAKVDSKAARWSLWEWLWQGKRTRTLREQAGAISERAKLFTARAQCSLNAAESLIQQQSAEAELAALVPAAVLLKEAASWAALSLIDQKGLAAEGTDVRLDESGWTQVSEHVGLPDGADLYKNWLTQPAEALWDSPPTVSRLNELVEATSELVRASKRVFLELDAIWFRRTYRIGLPLVLAVLGVGMSAYAAHRDTVARETAFPWTASSGAGSGCVSPSQECAEVRYFFHTTEEEQPWIEFDLAGEKQIHGVKIANRNDCEYCPHRAVPLVAEISSDHEHWTEVGREDKAFDNWDLEIGKKARWIRFRSLKKTFLHFRQVRIRVD